MAAAKCCSCLFGAAQRGGEQAEEVVHGAVVGGAATDDDVHAGVRFQLGVRPTPAATAEPTLGAHDRRDRQQFQVVACRRCLGSAKPRIDAAARSRSPL